MATRMPPSSGGFKSRSGPSAKSDRTRQRRDPQSERLNSRGQRKTESGQRPIPFGSPSVSQLKQHGKRGRRQSALEKGQPLARSLAGNLAQQARLLIVWIILMVGGLGLAVNLYKLQVVQASGLQERAFEQQKFAPPKLVPRRPIIDRRGNILAMDRQVYTLYAHPQMFKKSPTQIAAKLATILDRPAAELEYQFKTADSGIRLADSLSREINQRILDLNTDGLELIPYFTRLYPYQNLAADVVGYLDLDHQAQAGIEYSQDNLLEPSVPEDSDAKTEASDSSQLTPGGFVAIDELRLQLTIDNRLQMAASSALKQQMQAFNAKRGTAIVMDARDGALLSLVQEPSYDPNQYYKFDMARFKNWALTDIYEPGSTFKPITVAIALESGAVQLDSIFHDEGQVYVDGWPIANADYEYAGARGAITLTEIVQYSSNVGMVHVAAQMQPEVFYSWLERLGMGQAVEIDLPFVTASYIKSEEDFTASPVNAATTAFGQGFAITPIQMIHMYGALANGGQLVTPHVVRGLFNSSGQSYWQPQLFPPRQVFSPQTTKAVLSMMESVVKDGTGKAAQIPNYRIAGKTGTAQKPNSGGGYSDYAKIVSFVGIVPAESPRYVILVVVDEPQGGSGGVVAAPIVKSIIEALIVTEGIPPAEKNR